MLPKGNAVKFCEMWTRLTTQPLVSTWGCYTLGWTQRASSDIRLCPNDVAPKKEVIEIIYHNAVW